MDRTCSRSIPRSKSSMSGWSLDSSTENRERDPDGSREESRPTGVGFHADALAPPPTPLDDFTTKALQLIPRGGDVSVSASDVRLAVRFEVGSSRVQPWPRLRRRATAPGARRKQPASGTDGSLREPGQLRSASCERMVRRQSIVSVVRPEESGEVENSSLPRARGARRTGDTARTERGGPSGGRPPRRFGDLQASGWCGASRSKSGESSPSSTCTSECTGLVTSGRAR